MEVLEKKTVIFCSSLASFITETSASTLRVKKQKLTGKKAEVTLLTVSQ